MALIEAFLNEGVKTDVWISLRSDGIQGNGSSGNPYFGGTSFGLPIPVSLIPNENEGFADTGGVPHEFIEGDIVRISGVTGPNAAQWNRTFAIYDVTPTTFEFARGVPFQTGEGFPVATRLIFHFDRVLRDLPPSTRVNIGPGTFQTRGFAPGRVAGWQPKSGQKIVGAGYDATVVQLVGAAVIKPNPSTRIEEHYHAIGMPIVPTGITPIAPLEHFEVNDLTIDCNVDNQSLVEQDTYAKVACGAIRVLGNHCRLRSVKAINFGTKSFQQGCFVFSIIGASAAPNDGNGDPIVTGKMNNGIEDCIAVRPSQNSARETTVLHLGGIKNATNHAQAFQLASYIRKNFVDCQYVPAVGDPFSSAFITGGAGTGLGALDGKFVGKRRHSGRSGLMRFYHPRNPASKWNGYFNVTPVASNAYELTVNQVAIAAGDPDSSFVVMGTEFRGIAVTAGINTVVEQNQIHNCWIGGPYQSPFDSTVTEPSSPPTLAREERLDLLNALHIRSLIVRDNHYRNVAVGPYFNAGGTAQYVSQVEFSPDPIPPATTPFYLINASSNLNLWLNASLLIEWKCDQWPNPDVTLLLPSQVINFEGPHEVWMAVPPEFANYLNVTFSVPYTSRNYWRVFGTDYLIIEGNQIGLADFDETEFSIKEYPLSSGKYRCYGIIVADNELPAGHAHRQVFIRNNKISYVDTRMASTQPGIKDPFGGAMLLAGIKQLQVTHNLLEVRGLHPMRTYRCGKTFFFNNKKPNGEIVPGWRSESDSHYDEPETILEDAFVLSLLMKEKRTR